LGLDPFETLHSSSFIAMPGESSVLCPFDQTELKITDRQGIEIDYCPKCRGVWLDRGELDKLIERSAGAGAGTATQMPSGPHAPRYRDSYGEGGEGGEHGHHGKHRRKSFLGDIFDF
jgi:Zn-finger nucleic acid-binding protein